MERTLTDLLIYKLPSSLHNLLGYIMLERVENLLKSMAYGQE